VLDLGHSRVQIIDRRSGGIVGSVGQDNKAEENFSLPTNISTDQKGNVYVTNIGNGRIIKLDRDGHFLSGAGKLGTAFGQFGRPKGVAVDNDGFVYVVDAAAQNVQIFDEQMRLLMFFANPGSQGGALNIPAGITVSADSLEYYQTLAERDFILEKVVYVVSQVGDNKINIYGIGKKKGLDYEADIRQAMEERVKLEQKYREEAEKKLKEATEKKTTETNIPLEKKSDKQLMKDVPVVKQGNVK